MSRFTRYVTIWKLQLVVKIFVLLYFIYFYMQSNSAVYYFVYFYIYFLFV